MENSKTIESTTLVIRRACVISIHRLAKYHQIIYPKHIVKKNTCHQIDTNYHIFSRSSVASASSSVFDIEDEGAKNVTTGCLQSQQTELYSSHTAAASQVNMVHFLPSSHAVAEPVFASPASKLTELVLIDQSRNPTGLYCDPLFLESVGPA